MLAGRVIQGKSAPCPEARHIAGTVALGRQVHAELDRSPHSIQVSVFRADQFVAQVGSAVRTSTWACNWPGLPGSFGFAPCLWRLLSGTDETAVADTLPATSAW
jgi:hypothetical protein